MQRATAKMAKSITTTSTRHLTTMTRSRVQNRTNITPLPLSTIQSATTPTVNTAAQRFAPTSKGWNKKTSQAHIDAKHRKLIKQRYHGTDYCEPFPIMNMSKFRRLPRPLFIESEVMNLFIPAPQYEVQASRNAFTVAQQAAQRPY